MVSIINSWAQGIVVAIIIATIIEFIIPEGNNKKYIKTIIGVYILFMMLYPLKKFNKINVNSIIEDTSNKMNEYETEKLTLETNQYIEEIYTNKIIEDVKEKIIAKGYNVNLLQLKIENKNQESYGKVKSMNIQISKKEEMEENQDTTSNIIKNIENVEINLSNEPLENKENDNKEIEEPKIEELKTYLNNEYGTLKENIHINE